MRVLDTSTSTYSMVKKKRRLNKRDEFTADNSSDEVTMGGTGTAVRGCPHILKAINFPSIKKAIKLSVPFGVCMSCTKDANKKNERENERAAASNDVDEHLDNIETTIWLCLQCGHQGCDRNSKEKHALKHFQTPRSLCHSIAVNLSSWAVWCYDCDDEVHHEASKKLRECVDFARKQLGVGRTDTPVLSGKSINSLAKQSPLSSADSNTTGPISETKPRIVPSVPASLQNLPNVRGLSNLGNTCFFNAVLQNLSQTPELDALMAEHCKKGVVIELPGFKDDLSDSDSGSCSDDSESEACSTIPKHLGSISISLPEGGNLSQSLLSFLRDMHSTTKNNVISPSALFGQVCTKTPRFKSFQQQDSHELLRHLLDGMRSEETKRAQSGILKQFGLPENVNPRKVDEETKTKVKAYGAQAKKHTFVDSIFGGYLISTVRCQECDVASQIYEPFLDLSLPINEEKPGRPNISSNIKKDREKDKEIIREPSPEAPKKGIDGFFIDSTKPSKHQSKKNRKMTSKQRKLKKKNRAASSSAPCQPEEDVDPGSEEEAEGNADQTSPVAGEVENISEKSEKSNEWGSNDENNSDADIEDNLESDASRRKSVAPDNTIVDSPNDETAPLIPASPDVEVAEKLADDDSQAVNSEEEHENGLSDSESSTEDEVIEYMNLEEDHSDDGVESVAKKLANIAISGEEKTRSLADHIHVDCNQDGQNSHERKSDSPNLDESNSSVIDNDIEMDANGSTMASNHKASDSSLCNHDYCCHGKCACHDKTVCNSCCQDNSPLVSCNNCPVSAVKEKPGVDFDSKVNGNLKVDDGSIPSVVSAHDEASQVVPGSPPEGLVCNNTTLENSSSLASDQLGAYGGEDDLASTSQQNTPQHLLSKQGIKSKNDLKKEHVRQSMNTLSTRYQPLAHECSILSCLNQFTAAELLTGNNKFGCKTCTKQKHREKGKQDKIETIYTNACKQLLIFRPPAILTLHLKRFQQVGYSLRKVNRHVDFPLVLDLAPFCSSLAQGVKPKVGVKYSLYGVVEHSGRLTGGHYTAYVKVRPNCGKLRDFIQKRFFRKNWDIFGNDASDIHVQEEPTGVIAQGKWYYISDTHVKETTEAQVLKSQAYILFYERVV